MPICSAKNENRKSAFDWMHNQMEILAKRHNCIIVDPMPYMDPGYIGPCNMHPNAEVSQMVAGLIWQAMQAPNIDPAGIREKCERHFTLIVFHTNMKMFKNKP
jgi:hypothetical protein